MNKDILGYLSKTLNTDSEQIAELLYQKSDDGKTFTYELKPDGIKQLLSLDEARVKTLKPDTKEIFDNGYKKAEAKVSSDWEKNIRTSFGIDEAGELTGNELLDAVKTATAKQQSPDKVKSSAEYLQLERQAKAQLEELKAKHLEELDSVHGKFKQQQTWSQVQAAIKATLLEMSPVLPEDKAKQERLLELFTAQFSGYEYQADNGTFLPMKEGQRIENAQRYPKSLNDLVKEHAEAMFEFKQQDAAGNAGNSNGGTTGQKPAISTKFKDESDYLKQYNEADAEGKKALYAAWTSAQGEGGGE